MKLRMVMAAVAVAAMSILSACKDSGTQLAVTYATLRYIEDAGDPAAQTSRAAEVRAIAEQVQALAGGEAVTVDALKAYVQGKLPADMPASDRLLALAIIDVVAVELQDKIGDGVIDPEKLPKVQKILGFVIGATAYFPPA